MDSLPAQPPAQEQVIEQRLLACGLESKGFTVKYEDYLQSIEIVIQPNAGATAAQFSCIKQATGYEIVKFADSVMHAAYSDFLSELARPTLLAELETTLKKRRLWKGFPERAKFSDLSEFAKALENRAGFAPGTALRVAGNSIVVDAPHEGTASSRVVDRQADLMAVIAYAAIRDRVSFGFIGNEFTDDQSANFDQR